MTTTIRRLTLGVAGLALTAASLTACGGGDDADSAGSDTSASASESASAEASPSDDASSDAGDEADTEGETDSSTADFCGVYGNLFEEISGSLTAGGDISSVIPQLKDYAQQLEDVGAPDDIPEDAERGFEVSLEAINDLPDDATQEDLINNSQNYSAEDQADAQAFGQYVLSACPDLVPAGAVPSAPSTP